VRSAVIPVDSRSCLWVKDVAASPRPFKAGERAFVLPRPLAAGMFDQLAYQLSMAKAWVYMLRCVDGSLYTGWTVDVRRRVARDRASTASQQAVARGSSISLSCPRPA